MHLRRVERGRDGPERYRNVSVVGEVSRNRVVRIVGDRQRQTPRDHSARSCDNDLERIMNASSMSRTTIEFGQCESQNGESIGLSCLEKEASKAGKERGDNAIVVEFLCRQPCSKCRVGERGSLLPSYNRSHL